MNKTDLILKENRDLSMMSTTSLSEIILEYVRKHELDIEPIQNILNKGIFTGEHTAE